MALKNLIYFVDGKKKKIRAKEVSVFSSGLMFRKKSPPLFFNLGREKKFSITGIFCRPFRAIWLDDKMSSTQVVDVKNGEFRIAGKGRYLLEIPLTTKK